MRALLVLLAVAASFIIVTALVQQKTEQPPQIAVISTESPIPTPVQVNPKLEKSIPPATIKMPEPILITSWKDAARISDPNLRAFARRKADFRNDNVLFFEWKGPSGDKLTGDLTTKDKKYIITLHHEPTSTGEVIHRQLFVIPAAYTYVCEIEK
jgi:hypothetical protein